MSSISAQESARAVVGGVATNPPSFLNHVPYFATTPTALASLCNEPSGVSQHAATPPRRCPNTASPHPIPVTTSESPNSSASEQLYRLSSRISSGFSSASSDSAETSLTSISQSSDTSREPSPRLSGVSCHSGSTLLPRYLKSAAVRGQDPYGNLYVSGLAAGCSCVSSPARSPISPRHNGSSAGKHTSLSNHPASHSWSSPLAGPGVSFFLPGPAMSLPYDSAPSTAPSTSSRNSIEGDTKSGCVQLKPPENLGLVAPQLYRSSFPRREHFPFLRSLGLKSVLTLVQEEYPAENLAFLEEAGIKFFQFSIPGNKEPFVHIPEDKIRLALAQVLDRRNYPMLIHCNKGRHRTGCLVGCLRKMQHWSSTAIFDEYRRYSYPKSRNMDQQFIELFDQSAVWGELDAEHAPPWLDLSA